MLGWLTLPAARWAALVALLLSLAAVVWTVTPVPASGRLVDAAGRPVAGALVTEPGAALWPATHTQSDAAGRYRVTMRRWPLQPGGLTVVADGFETATTGGGDLVLHRWPVVSGQVVDDAGTPLAGAIVTLATPASAIVSAAMSDLRGHFQLIAPGVAGPTVVTASADAHDDGTQNVTVAADQAAAATLRLPRQLAKLHLVSVPAGQAPRVDGQAPPDCPATPCDVQVLAGMHEVTFGGDLFVPWSGDVQVARNATASVQATLERRTGTLVVQAPAGGDVSVDGVRVGASPWTGAVATGQHTIADRAAGTWPAIATATIDWNQTSQVALTPTRVAPNDTTGFVAGLKAYLAAQGSGSFGVYLEDLGTGITVGVGDTARLEAASVIKVPEALYLLHQVDAGDVDLTDQVTLEAGDFMGGTGSLYTTAHPGQMLSYQQLLTVLIRQSDNTAWLALRRLLGDGSIDAYAASVGAGDCVQETDACSARSAGHLLAQLARGRLLGGSSTQLLMGLLETTIYNDRIPYYLGSTTVAHKVGMDPSNGVANDCGVVMAPARPFAVCVFTTTGNPDNGAQVVRDIARAAAALW